MSQLMKDYENVEDVNKQLDRMGYNIGVRMVEDFLARTNAGRCYDLRETADKIQVRIVFRYLYLKRFISQLLQFEVFIFFIICLF